MDHHGTSLGVMGCITLVPWEKLVLGYTVLNSSPGSHQCYMQITPLCYTNCNLIWKSMHTELAFMCTLIDQFIVINITLQRVQPWLLWSHIDINVSKKHWYVHTFHGRSRHMIEQRCIVSNFALPLWNVLHHRWSTNGESLVIELAQMGLEGPADKWPLTAMELQRSH